MIPTLTQTSSGLIRPGRINCQKPIAHSGAM